MNEPAPYDAIPAIRWSLLREAAKSPAHYHWRLENPRPDTAAMAAGRLVHCAVLEPDELPRRYAVWGEARRGSDWRAFEAAAIGNGQEVVTAAEYERAIAMRDAVHTHPVAARYLSQKRARTEVTLTWTDAQTKLACKARLDWLGTRTFIDLKTTRDNAERAFGRVAGSLAYHGQMAFYNMGLVASGMKRRAVIVAVESEEPCDVACYRLGWEEMDAGTELARELLETVAACTRRGKWPGAHPKETQLRLPPWYYPKDDDIGGLGIAFKEAP